MTRWEKTSFDLGLSSSPALVPPAQTREGSCTGLSGKTGHLISLTRCGRRYGAVGDGRLKSETVPRPGEPSYSFWSRALCLARDERDVMTKKRTTIGAAAQSTAKLAPLPSGTLAPPCQIASQSPCSAIILTAFKTPIYAST